MMKVSWNEILNEMMINELSKRNELVFCSSSSSSSFDFSTTIYIRETKNPISAPSSFDFSATIYIRETKHASHWSPRPYFNHILNIHLKRTNDCNDNFGSDDTAAISFFFSGAQWCNFCVWRWAKLWTGGRMQFDSTTYLFKHLKYTNNT